MQDLARNVKSAQAQAAVERETWEKYLPVDWTLYKYMTNEELK